jgi:hypothetical protein
MASTSPGRALGSVRRRLTYANVMATVAVFLALGGGAYAATQLPDRSVGTRQLRRDAVTRSRLADDSVGTTQLVHDGVTLNRLSAGVRSLLRREKAGSTGPAGAPGTAGAPGAMGAPGARGTSSYAATGPDTTAYVSGATLASVSVPAAGLHILFGSVTLTNNGPDPIDNGGCGLFNGSRQLQAGNGVNLAPGETATLSLPGLDEVRDSSQPVTMMCQFSGTGPVAASGAAVRAVRLEG